MDVRSAKIVAGLEPENTCYMLSLLGKYASNTSINSDDIVRRCLNGEQPGDQPPPRQSQSQAPPRSESKSEPPGDSGAKDYGGSKADDFKFGEKRDDEPTERGKSRGGTRGGARASQQSTSGAGLGAPPGRSPAVDAELNNCDGNIEFTKEILGSLITRPKLADKLLQKPPFRFLYDVIMEIVTVTGFGQGLYSGEELDSANIKEKEQKISFLDKMIFLVGMHLSTIVEAKSGKIVAGLEPQDTNRFLQLLAVCAKHLPDSRANVRRVMEQFGGNEPEAVSAQAQPVAPARNEPPQENVRASNRDAERERERERPRAEEKQPEKPARVEDKPQRQPVRQVMNDSAWYCS